MTVLRKYFEKGWLKYGYALLSERDRLRAGERMCADFHKAGIDGVKAIDYSKLKVDEIGVKDVPEYVLDARKRLNDAIMALKHDESFIVWTVVCLDKPLKLKNSGEYRHDIEVLKEKICESLDALCFHYWGKPAGAKKHKIEAMISEKAMQEWGKWKEKLLK